MKTTLAFVMLAVAVLGAVAFEKSTLRLRLAVAPDGKLAAFSLTLESAR